MTNNAIVPINLCARRVHIFVSAPKNCVALNDAYLSVPAKTFPSLGLHIFEDYIKEVLTKGVGFSTSKSPDPVFATWDETSNIAPSTREEQVLPSLVTWK